MVQFLTGTRDRPADTNHEDLRGRTTTRSGGTAASPAVPCVRPNGGSSLVVPRSQVLFAVVIPDFDAPARRGPAADLFGGRVRAGGGEHLLSASASNRFHGHHAQGSMRRGVQPRVFEQSAGQIAICWQVAEHALTAVGTVGDHVKMPGFPVMAQQRQHLDRQLGTSARRTAVLRGARRAVFPGHVTRRQDPPRDRVPPGEHPAGQHRGQAVECRRGPRHGQSRQHSHKPRYKFPREPPCSMLESDVPSIVVEAHTFPQTTFCSP